MKKIKIIITVSILALLVIGCEAPETTEVIDDRVKETVNMPIIKTVLNTSAIRVTLLGTGTPMPSTVRFGPATLVEVGGEKLLFDAGRGVTVRLAQAKVSITDLTVFLTHLHSDHINGLTDLWLSSYLAPQFKGAPFIIYGPKGIDKLTDGIKMSSQPDLDIRAIERAKWGQSDISGVDFKVIEVKNEGVVFEKEGIIVSAIKVIHAAGNAFGYRVDYKGKSVVISGDTKFSENLIKKSKGADLIIHEVMGVNEKQMKIPLIKGVMEVHTTPEQAGRLFTKVKPKMAVYTHILLFGVSEDELITKTRKTYSGPLVVGYDMMTIDVDEEVTIINEMKK